MFIQVKQITSFVLILFMGFSLSAQEADTVVYSEADSLQDVMLKQLEQQLKTVNSKLWVFNQQQKELTDSLELVNNEQAARIMSLEDGSENLEKKLQLAEAEIENNDRKLLEEKKRFRQALFITVPILFIVSVVLAALLFLLVRKYKNTTDFQLNALRKYTYDGLEDVKAGYAAEIKRRVKKITAKLKPKSKKGNSNPKKRNAKKAKVNKQKAKSKSKK